MGIGGISVWQLLIILAIVVMLFGTKRLRNMGGDLGAAVKGFRSSVNAEDDEKETEDETAKVENGDDKPHTP
ncbi:twin-arginine translocase TatA/TatE family subunit [Halieaceae bacterium IMCC14734]|uniref:Sec-independent protein translocase protein TatA n=1 Tax=Candidatus Litorirhabdus singularis TaxID=2518993 RepID=A0ABT3TBW3_9GAMM|nr:twin-arginine translocase TatA/TatE family subunit [Candidatus Litorirhabdus singularis]MCX2979793.1 twin-arginine translocase TatA/TatE family subunit [Candidatus Litorirhabdus singularis]